MPSVFNGLQSAEEKRIKGFKQCMTDCTLTEKKVYPIINTCLEGILKACSEIDENTVSFRKYSLKHS